MVFNSKSDNSKYVDPSHIAYVYNDEDDTWKKFGYVSEIKLVDDENNGLVYPELYEKLELIADLFKDGAFRNFKLTNDKPYFYYFYNSDKLISFKYDNLGNELWIEINRGSLIRRLVSHLMCVGERGDKGVIGDSGFNGRSAAREKYKSIINGKFDIPVNVPLSDQPISIRGFDGDDIQKWEVLVNLDGSFEDKDGRFVSLKFVNNRLIGELSNKVDRVKVRQRGSKGLPGRDGLNYIELINNYIDDVKRQTAVISLFKRKVNNNFIYRSAVVVGDKNCVFTLSPLSGMPVSDYWVGLEVTTRDCKDFRYLKPEVDAIKPVLNLPTWTPTTACFDQRRYQFGNLDWLGDFQPPWDILQDPEPKMGSCAEPFWFCGNSGNAPCDGNIDLKINPVVFFDEETSSSSSSSSSSSTSSMSSSSSISSSSSSNSSSTSSTSSSSSNSTNSSSTSSSSSDSSSSNSSLSLSSNSSLSLSSNSSLSLSSNSSLNSNSSLSSSSSSSLSSLSKDLGFSSSSSSSDSSSSSSSNSSNSPISECFCSQEGVIYTFNTGNAPPTSIMDLSWLLWDPTTGAGTKGAISPDCPDEPRLWTLYENNYNISYAGGIVDEDGSISGTPGTLIILSYLYPYRTAYLTKPSSPVDDITFVSNFSCSGLMQIRTYCP